jgi:hypothetical protein
MAERMTANCKINNANCKLGRRSYTSLSLSPRTVLHAQRFPPHVLVVLPVLPGTKLDLDFAARFSPEQRIDFSHWGGANLHNSRGKQALYDFRLYSSHELEQARADNFATGQPADSSSGRRHLSLPQIGVAKNRSHLSSADQGRPTASLADIDLLLETTRRCSKPADNRRRPFRRGTRGPHRAAADGRRRRAGPAVTATRAFDPADRRGRGRAFRRRSGGIGTARPQRRCGEVRGRGVGLPADGLVAAGDRKALWRDRLCRRKHDP